MIEIREYVRTKSGKIDKVINSNFYMSIYVECEKGLYLIENIVKHSKQLIDLVEIKDICMFENNCVYIYDNEFLNAIKENVKNGNRLLKILTKEQFEQNSYKVGEDDE